MEQFIATQIKTNEALSSSINQLTSKFDTMAAHKRLMDTQIAQQVSSLSKPQGQLLGQPETDPWGHVNALSTVGEGLEERLMLVLQETVSVPNSAGTYEQKEEESLSSIRKVSPAPTVHPYQPLVPYPQRVAWAKSF